MKFKKTKEIIKKEFKSIKLRQVFGLAPVAGCTAYIFIDGNMDFSRLFILTGLALFFSSINWRCPACDEYLSHLPLKLHKCSKCGAELN